MRTVPLPEDEDSVPTSSMRRNVLMRRAGSAEEYRRAIHRCIGVAALRARRHSNESDAKTQACGTEQTERKRTKRLYLLLLFLLLQTAACSV